MGLLKFDEILRRGGSIDMVVLPEFIIITCRNFGQMLSEMQYNKPKERFFKECKSNSILKIISRCVLMKREKGILRDTVHSENPHADKRGSKFHHLQCSSEDFSII